MDYVAKTALLRADGSIDAVDQEEPEIRAATAKELKQKIASMEAKMEELQGIEAEVCMTSAPMGQS